MGDWDDDWNVDRDGGLRWWLRCWSRWGIEMMTEMLIEMGLCFVGQNISSVKSFVDQQKIRHFSPTKTFNQYWNFKFFQKHYFRKNIYIYFSHSFFSSSWKLYPLVAITSGFRMDYTGNQQTRIIQSLFVYEDGVSK